MRLSDLAIKDLFKVKRFYFPCLIDGSINKIDMSPQDWMSCTFVYPFVKIGAGQFKTEIDLRYSFTTKKEAIAYEKAFRLYMSKK